MKHNKPNSDYKMIVAPKGRKLCFLDVNRIEHQENEGRLVISCLLNANHKKSGH